MTCPQCHAPINDDAKFCPVCGMAIEEKKCINCSSPISADAKFCAKCGADQTPPQNQTCAKCNAPLEANQKFCTVCGAPVEKAENPEENKLAAQALTFGILGLAFSLSFWLSVLGIVFSSVARVKKNKYLKLAGRYKDARAGVGNGLSIGGLVAGIVFTAILAIIILAAIDDPSLFFEGSDYYYYYSI